MSTETKTLHPQIDVFPACTNCGSAYVLRRGLVMNMGTGDLRVDWAWQKDCRPKTPCKKAPAELLNADGTAYPNSDPGQGDSQ